MTFKEFKPGLTLCEITYEHNGKIYNELLTKKEIAELNGYQFVRILDTTWIAQPGDLGEETLFLQSFDSYYSSIHPVQWSYVLNRIHDKIYGSGRLTGGGSNVHPIFSNILNSF